MGNICILPANRRVTVNDQGALVTKDDYYPFGLQMPGLSYNNGITNDYLKYSSKELDKEHGLDWYYFGARYYDPTIGRWLSVDPKLFKYPSSSPFNYVLNNPIVAIDIRGEDVFIVISGEVNRVVTNYRMAYQWDQGITRPEEKQFATYKMNVSDYGEQLYLGGSLEENGISWLTDKYEFEVGRDAWYQTVKRGEQRYGSNNETPPGFYEINDRTKEPNGPNGRPPKGKRKGWFGVNDLGKIGGIILSGPHGPRTGISIHPGNPNYAAGCFTMDIESFKKFKAIVLKRLNQGQAVYIKVNGRLAKFNTTLKRWEYVKDEDDIHVQN